MMRKCIHLRKDADRAVVRDGTGRVLMDVEVAQSSPTRNAYLAFQIADDDVKVERVPKQ